jgi:putative ABC transport system permease protein
LKKIRKVTVVDALVNGKGFEKDKRAIKDGLHKSRKLPINWVIGIREVFYKFKNWIIIFAVVSIAVLMIMVPVNLLNTFEAPEFITYMGSSLEDILIEVENGENLETGYRNVNRFWKRMLLSKTITNIERYVSRLLILKMYL